MSATRDDCPCCDANTKTPTAIDASMVSAFMGGVMAAKTEVSIGDALCEKHMRMAADCMAFVEAGMRKAGARS